MYDIRCIFLDWDGTLQHVSRVKLFGYKMLGMLGYGQLRQRVFECIEFFDCFLARPHMVISKFGLLKLAKRYHLGIVTNRSKVFLERMLKRAKIQEGLFDVIGATRGLWDTWCDNSGEWILIAPKPSHFLDHFRFLTFFKKYELTPSEILFIGDDVSDYVSVKEVGVHFAGIASTESRRKAFISVGLSEEFVFPTLKDALHHFDIFVN